MKACLLSLMLALCAAAQSAPSTQSALPQDNSARKARVLIDQCIQALGGQAWLNVQDMEQQGRTYGFYHGQPNSLGTPFWRFWKYPDKDRIELTKQRDVVYVHNGEKGYEITYKGTAFEEADATADFVRRQRHSLEVVLRQWLSQPGTALFYDGPAVAEQRQASSVTIVNSENDSVTLFLDINTHLPIKKTFIWRDQDRYRNEESEVYDNWRPEQGVMTAHSTLRVKNGDITNQRFLTTVKYNQGLSDSLFQASITYDPKATRKK
jgi:hypothetical protein